MIKLKNLKNLYDHLVKSRQMVGLKKAGTRYEYQVLEQYDDWAQDVLLGNFSPKEIFFPHDETLFYFKEQKLIEPKEEIKSTVLWGVRSCDIAGILELERMFNQVEYKDPYFMKRFERTLIVGVACADPWPGCFCTSVQGSPYKKDGADVFLYPTSDGGRQGYLVEAVSKKGESVLDGFSAGDSADNANQLIAAGKEKAEKAIKRYEFSGIAEKLRQMVDSKFWDSVHNPCIGCGTCAFVCPSCHCFDINDASKGSRGLRSRQWDSCLYDVYTLETSGHNPRPSGASRWRQRLNHKFNYFMEVFGIYQCLGCGRCARACPVNINIAEMATKALTWEEPE